MADRFARDVDDLLARCRPAVARKARELIVVVRDIRPELAARVRFGWGTVNFTHPAAGYLCAIWPGRDHASLVFAQGRLLDHPLLVDDGKVVRVRWIPFAPDDAVPIDEIAILIAESIALRT